MNMSLPQAGVPTMDLGTKPYNYIQKYKIMPQADKYKDSIIQYVGETNTDYINGYFYISDGVTWARKDVQPHSDAVSSVNGQTGAVVLGAENVGALPNTTEIPTKTSDLQNDSDFVADANYQHTDNNYTTAEKNKLTGVETGAEKNIIKSLQVTKKDGDYPATVDSDGKAYIDVSDLEQITNKVTTISEVSTDDEYPSAKAVYDAIQSSGGGTVSDVQQNGQSVLDGSVAKLDAYTRAEALELFCPKKTTDASVIDDAIELDMLSYEIDGNTEITGTPSVENPAIFHNLGDYNETTGKYDISIIKDDESIWTFSQNEPLCGIENVVDSITSDGIYIQRIVRCNNSLFNSLSVNKKFDTYTEFYVHLGTYITARQGETFVKNNIFNDPYAIFAFNGQGHLLKFHAYHNAAGITTDMSDEDRIKAVKRCFGLLVDGIEPTSDWSNIEVYYTRAIPIITDIEVPTVHLTTNTNTITTDTTVQPTRFTKTYYQNINKAVADLQALTLN